MLNEQYELCRGKRVYDKKGALTAKNKRFNDDHVALRIYECPVGGHWHLTSSMPYKGNNKIKYAKRFRK